ncbi:recombinase family protein [Streptomyces sp. NPDC058319]|uniref:recombinase family protein n=1 Tax=unclassified Streptomyces TaxID=2593676 RepID=UPI0036EE5155
MKPLIFGYMRVPDELTEEEAKRREDAIKAYAEKEGFTLVTIFQETQQFHFSAFEELMNALQEAEARRVVVPCYDDFAASYHLQTALVLQVQHEASAQVIALDEL